MTNEQLYDCIVRGCDKRRFTKRGFILHIKAKHPDFYNKWQVGNKWQATESRIL